MSEYDEERDFGDVVLRRKDKSVLLQTADLEVSFELGSLTEMFEEPDLPAGGTTRVIASPPTQYLLFGNRTLGLQNVTSGEYRLTWIDVATGEMSDGGTTAVGGGDELFEAPIGGSVILVLKRIGR